MKKAAIITIGDEILYGQITDTNSAWIGEQLTMAGIKPVWKISVGDSKEDISDALETASLRADIVIITGGLGPTKDDITKTTLCDFFGTGLILNEQALAQVTQFFNQRGKELSELNRAQAYLPQNCRYLPNRFGTAPGMAFEKQGKFYFSLPGVPYEMKGIMAEEVLPLLAGAVESMAVTHRMIRTTGIAESDLSEEIELWEKQLPQNIKLAYLPSAGEVKLRLTAFGPSAEDNVKNIQEQIDKLDSLIANYVFSYENETLEEAVGRQLRDNNLTISTAESCTGGYLAHLITSVAGSSDYFTGSVVAYSNEIKKCFLEISDRTLSSFGAVSEETVSEMAKTVRLKFKSDIGVATSGIAGPGGGTAEKPVGTVWIALADDKGLVTKKLMLGDQRDLNIRRSAVAVLDLVRQRINKND